ncbi:hypothetical protein SOCE26_036320 [Sorangium cellulosum]|uniref:DUF4112 domain-containing protein n=1 Tax=Sorangium cellulosum TaxID=56 RepID=A0A2L0ESE3_SORCE|nr:DUF4112 domain-containing protein [Sorangium cellulosum]AUX42205.1 hypothetical protein SOCE26_036320 [Sorangium cellulosum]
MPATPLTTLQTARPEDERLKRLTWLGHFLDNSIRIPGVGYRVGYDAVIGLIPGVGDLVGLGLSVYIVLAATRYRLPASTLLRMVLNVGLETLIGTVPLVGDLFDAAYKANARNLGLLHAHLAARGQGSAQPSDLRFYAGLLFVLVSVLVLTGLLLFSLIRALEGLLGA